MNEMSFSLRLGARDDSQAGVRAWQSSIMGAVKAVSKPITIPLKIGAAGLGLLRDINLGLRPLMEGLDRIIERGTALDATRKSFISLVGGGSRYADQLAERLVAASHGTLRVAEAMQLANRSIVAGIDTAKDLPTILDFAAKKAVTTGMDFGGSMDRIVMGLIRGNSRMLHDFGLLTDGLEGVQRTYEAIKGAGAWEQLGPAGQKAELVRQAMADMHRQLGRLGVRGTETIFVWKQIKTQIGDATDKLFAAVGRSESLRNVLGGIRDVIGGMTKHMEKGGSLAELLFGKEGGESGGLFGGLKAGVLDAGELIGRGILGGVLKGISLLPDLFNAAWEKLKAAWTWAIDKIPPAIISGLTWLKTDFIPLLKSEFNELIGSLRELLRGPAGKVEGMLPKDIQSKWQGVEGTAMERGGDPMARTILGATEWFGKLYLDKVGRPGLRFLKGLTGMGGAATQPAGAGLGYGFGVMPAALGAAATGTGHGRGVTSKAPKKSFFDWAGEKGGEFLHGGVLGGKWRASTWWEQFGSEYPPGGGRYTPGAPPPEAKGMRLTAAGAASRERSIRLLDREIRKEEGLARREARRAAGERARELYRQGYEVTPEDRARLEADAYEQIAGVRSGPARKRRDAIKAELESRQKQTTLTEEELAGIGRTVPAAGPAGSAAEGAKQTTSLLSRIAESAKEQVGLTKQLLGALGGAETAINRAATG